MKRFLAAVFTSAVTAGMTACTEDLTLTSPDEEIFLEFSIDNTGVPHYSISAYGQAVIATSALGMDAIGVDLDKGFAIKNIRRKKIDREWTQIWGENRHMRDRHNEMAVLMENEEGVALTLRFRAFDDGIGFRYEYSTAADSLTIVNENTGFNFASDGTSWSIGSYFSGYELPYREQTISATENANTPFTFRMGNVFGSIHEAALYDFPEMNIYRKDSLSFKSELAPSPDGMTAARTGGSFTTAWRTFQLSRSSIGLINSSLILNLNEPCAIEDASWIRPQKYVGVWWGMHLGTQVWTIGPRHGATTENAIRHIDFAASNNIGGVLFEGWNQGWESWGGRQHFNYCEPYADFDLERIAAYAKEKGISLWMHNETGGNIYEYERNMDKAFAKYASLGVHYLKTGYAGGMPDGIRHHSQRGVQHYQKVVEKAAEYRIAIDAHEPIKETGIRRTWPNMMTREGARGMEWNAWSEGNSSEYLCILPFVRLLSGPMDYTPGVFDIYYRTACATPGREEWNGDNSRTFVKTTLARQIANWVIIYSPLQMACDLIENYEGHPAFRFFRDFDPDCDWSEALAGEIGDYIVTVRRAKDRFFLGAGTDDDPRT
ncbi:MAG: glycoside hydrolase family 97 catalytic domain-containing protein, partial [Bacteroidales bacterium]|nr:glycoside hydrolase family 97 catalytic domain-containing protein [Bacteroidales bacterium]